MTHDIFLKKDEITLASDHVKAKNCLSLFLSFLKIGAVCFGGGAAMISFISAEAVEKHGWAAPEEMNDIVTVSESTPGPIAVNAATFVGCRVAGAAGAACATVGTVLPAFAIMIAVAMFMDFFKSLTVISYIFAGVRVGVIALILKAFISIVESSKKDIFYYVVFAAAFIAVAVFGVNTIAVIVCAALIGIGSAVAGIVTRRNAQ